MGEVVVLTDDVLDILPPLLPRIVLGVMQSNCSADLMEAATEILKALAATEANQPILFQFTGLVEVLVQSIAHASDHVKKNSAETIAHLGCCEENQVSLASAQNCLPRLAALLRVRSPEVVERAAQALSALSTHADNTASILRIKDLMQSLQHVLETGSLVAKSHVARVIDNLVTLSNDALIIARCPLLVDNLTALAKTLDVEARECALGALSALAQRKDFRAAFSLLELLEESDEAWVCKLTQSVIDFVRQGTDYAQERSIFERLVHNQRVLEEFVNVLQRGTPEAKETVAWLFASLASREDAVMPLSAIPGAITSLVNLMEAGTNIAKQRAALALERLTVTQENKILLCRSPPVLATLQASLASKNTACEGAAGIVSNLCSCVDNHALILNCKGMLEALNTLIVTGGLGSARQKASLALGRLAENPDVERRLMSLPHLPNALAIMLRTGTDAEKEPAAFLVASLAAFPGSKSRLCLVEGLLDAVVFAMSSPVPNECQHHAARAILNLAVDQEVKARLGTVNGILPVLVGLTLVGFDSAKEAAVWVLALFVEVPQFQEMLLKVTNCLKGLVAILHNSTDIAKEGATWILSLLSNSFVGKELLLKEPGLLAGLCQVLNSSQETIKENAACTLSAMCQHQRFQSLLASFPDKQRLCANVVNLTTGTEVMKEEGFVIIAELAKQPENHENLLGVDGLVGILVAALTQETTTIQEHAAETISLLSSNLNSKDILSQAPGLIKALSSLMNHGSPIAKEHSFVAFGNLAENTGGQTAHSEHSAALRSLVRTVRTASETAQERAAQALASLAALPDNQIAIASTEEIWEAVVAAASRGSDTTKEAIAELLALLSCNAENLPLFAPRHEVMEVIVLFLDSGTDSAREQAAKAASNLAEDPATQEAYLRHPNSVTALLVATLEGTDTAKDFAVRALAFFASDPQNIEVLHNTPDLVDILLYLSKEDLVCQENALRALSCLSEDPSFQQELGRVEGFVEDLVRILAGQHEAAKEGASWVLANLANTDENKINISEIVGIWDVLVKCIKDSQDFTKEGCAQTLALLAKDADNQVIMCEADGLLEALVDLMTFGTDVAKQSAGAALFGVLATKENRPIVAAIPGVIDTLVVLVTNRDPACREVAARVLALLSQDKDAKKCLLLSDELLPALLGVLGPEHTEATNDAACRAVANLCTEQTIQESVLQNATAVEALKQLCASSNDKTKTTAHGLLARLGVETPNSFRAPRSWRKLSQTSMASSSTKTTPTSLKLQPGVAGRQPLSGPSRVTPSEISSSLRPASSGSFSTNSMRRTNGHNGDVMQNGYN